MIKHVPPLGSEHDPNDAEHTTPVQNAEFPVASSIAFLIPLRQPAVRDEQMGVHGVGVQD